MSTYSDSGMIYLYIIVGLIFGFIFGFIGKKISVDKGRSPGEGFALGFFLGVIGLIIIILQSRNLEAIEQSNIASGLYKKCPYCAEVIKSEAVVCRYCCKELPFSIKSESQMIGASEGSAIKKPKLEDIKNEKKPISKKKLAFIEIIVVVVLISIIVLILGIDKLNVSNRVTFQTNDEMRAYLVGSWESDYATFKFYPKGYTSDIGNEICDYSINSIRFSGFGIWYDFQIQFNPKRGSFYIKDEGSGYLIANSSGKATLIYDGNSFIWHKLEAP
jgi:uncharacterized membrane protein YeaQ/YmgE (transglycosylase-associated protein family)